MASHKWRAVVQCLKADRIFKAFFFTKAHGTGMGLDNSPRGASFHLTLPTKIEAQE
jgi:hypothetical protein